MGKLNYNPSKTGKHITYVMSDLQKLAQKENFALFTLVGMCSNLYHLQSVCNKEEVNKLRALVSKLESDIRTAQSIRKSERSGKFPKKASKSK